MRLQLNAHDIASPLWHKLQEYYRARLQDMRAQLETDRSHEETMKLRARISEVKAFLDLGEPPNQKTKYDAS